MFCAELRLGWQFCSYLRVEICWNLKRNGGWTRVNVPLTSIPRSLLNTVLMFWAVNWAAVLCRYSSNIFWNSVEQCGLLSPFFRIRSLVMEKITNKSLISWKIIERLCCLLVPLLFFVSLVWFHYAKIKYRPLFAWLTLLGQQHISNFFEIHGTPSCRLKLLDTNLAAVAAAEVKMFMFQLCSCGNLKMLQT